MDNCWEVEEEEEVEKCGDTWEHSFVWVRGRPREVLEAECC